MIKLQKQNYLIIYVSHFLESILSVCNKVTILRDGKLIRTSNINDENKTSLVEAMLGKSAEVAVSKKEVNTIIKKPKKIIDITNLKTETGVNDVSINIKEGEIVGLLGLVGSGRTETLRAIFGADNIADGKIIFLNEDIKIKNPKNAIKNSIVMIPEDRRKLGLVLIKILNQIFPLQIQKK